MKWRKRRRSGLDIIASILHILEVKGQTKTAIMRKANLNFKRVNIYMAFLLSRGFVSISEGSLRRYVVTKKGLELLEDYRKLRENEDRLIEASKKLKSLLSLEED